MEQNTPMGGVQCPPNLTEQFALKNYSKSRVQTEFLHKIKISMMLYYDIISFNVRHNSGSLMPEMPYNVHL